MKLLILFGLAGVLGALFAAQSADSLLEKHTKQLQAAATLTAAYTIQSLPGAPADYKLEFGKPAKFRLETPKEIVVADGTTVSDYKKDDNTYSQVPQSDTDLKALLKRDAVLPWTAFFTKDPFKDYSGFRAGGSKIMKGKSVTEISMVLPGSPSRTAIFFIDQTLGVARGVSINAGPDKDTIILAKDLAVSTEPAKDADFEFTAPSGAKKVDPNATHPGTTWAKVSDVFQTNCGACHNSGRPRSGLDLSTYAGAIAGGRNGKDVVPGDPDNSPMMSYLHANGKPQMPPSGALADTDIAKIQAWIKDGANEK